MNTQKVGEQIAALRKGKGLTQNDLGERLGVAFQSVSKWKRGETLPDTAILVDLADVLETTVDFILTGGAYVDHTDVKHHFKQERFRKIVLDFCEKHGIK